MITTAERAADFLLSDRTLAEKCESIACLLNNRVFSDSAVCTVSNYANSEAPLMFGITLGELSSAYLDIADISEYRGNNQVTLSLIKENAFKIHQQTHWEVKTNENDTTRI